MNTNEQVKAGVSVAEMARSVGLSRARFYQLQGSAFPLPLYDIATRRPFFTESQQQVCLEVRKRNWGIDGKPVLFYAARFGSGGRKPKPPKRKLEPKGKDVAALVDGLNALGFTTATAARVQEVTQELFPNGTGNMDRAEVLRAVFLHLKRKNSADNVGR
jgi:hypothetical protein